MVLALLLLVTAIVAFTMYFTNVKDKKIDITNVPDSKLRDLVQVLTNKIEEMEFEDKNNRDRISALEVMSGIDREQTKYLSANVNALV